MPEALDQVVLARLLEMVGDDPEFVDELVDTYLGEAPEQIAAVRVAVASGSAEGVVRPAHTLKGSSANLGAARVEGICREIEEHGRAGTMDGLERLLADLDTAYAEIVTALAAARERRWAAQ